MIGAQGSCDTSHLVAVLVERYEVVQFTIMKTWCHFGNSRGPNRASLEDILDVNITAHVLR